MPTKRVSVRKLLSLATYNPGYAFKDKYFKITPDAVHCGAPLALGSAKKHVRNLLEHGVETKYIKIRMLRAGARTANLRQKCEA